MPLTGWRRPIREIWRVAGRVLPADTWAGDHARRLLVRFVPVPADSSPEAPAALAHPEDERFRVVVDHFLQDPGPTLTFPNCSSPTVSVIVVTHDSVPCTYRCLESLLAHGGGDYELVVADDGGLDGTGELLARLRSATIVRGEGSRGFGAACNQAAARARGRYLLLLDQCSALAAGSVAALLEAIEADPACGAVGGKLVLTDGRLQEAGSIIWRDGGVQAYGHGANALDPEFSYTREVDCSSSAFLMVRKDLFDQLGGFAPDFASAPQAESADFAMRLRRRGNRSLFEPRAVAFRCDHRQTSDKQTTAGSLPSFLAKWRLELDGQPDRLKVPLLVARDRAGGPRALVVEDRIPAASRGAGFPRSYALVEMLASLGYRVTLFPYQDKTRHQPWLQQLQSAGVEVMAAAVDFTAFAAERAGHYDAVVVSRPHNFRDVRPLLSRFFPRAAVVYDAEALFFLRDKVKAELDGVPWLGEASEREELSLLRAADVVVTVSDYERSVMTAAAPELADRIQIWGHPVRPLPTRTPFRERKDLLFVGGFQASPSPNEDAVLSFMREVLPRVRSRLRCRLQVVGFRSTEALRGRTSDDVNVMGYLDDLTACYEACRVFVVPHLYSAGIPLKLSEAMGRGIPSVVSDLIARQLGAEDGRDVLVGRTPEEFADRIVALYESEDLWTTVRENGLAFVRSRHDPETLESDLDAIITTAISAARQRSAADTRTPGEAAPRALDCPDTGPC